MTSLNQHRRSFIPQLPDSLKNFSHLRFLKEEVPTVTDPEVKELINNTADQPLLRLDRSDTPYSKALNVGVVLSGGQASGGHNVITGLYDALQLFSKESRLIGFLEGPSGIVNCQTTELTREVVDEYRNSGGFDMIGSGRTKIETEEQFTAAKETATKLNLDGLVIIGGDDSNTNAALLAEYFVKNQVPTRVVGVPKTIDGDLKNEHIEISFGFDTATKTYSEIIGNIARDALSAGKYYFFIKIMGRSASHVALECALKTHPNFTIISEEVAAKKKTLKQLSHEICDMICERASQGKHHGVVVIPEGAIEFIPEFKVLITELNDLLSKEEHSDAIGGINDRTERVRYVAGLLTNESMECYQTLPPEIQLQLILDRDPHGNVQVSKIESERLFIELAKAELKRRKNNGNITGKFSAQPFFCGYEGRSCLPSNFDAQYCYALGHTAALIIRSDLTGYMSCVQNLTAPATDWNIAGIPISTMMVMEKRKGKLKPVIRKALVELDGAPFTMFTQGRESWKLSDDYIYPGPIQFFGPEEVTNSVTITLSEERRHLFGYADYTN
ncbi:MAG: diphosphate--fructose-6-phosphate 1-phosphotransferase [Chlamydiota bacterium]